MRAQLALGRSLRNVMRTEKRKRAECFLFLTQNETRALLAEARRNSPRDYAMILLTYRHGLRCGEICGLMLKDLDLDAGRILCRRSKGSITNWQELAADEVEAVRAWLRRRPAKESPYLFVSQKGPGVSRKHFYRIVRRHGVAAGIPVDKCHPHALKHALGTQLANSGVPVQVIQQRLGHRSINNTMKYLAIASEYVDRAFREALANGAVV